MRNWIQAGLAVFVIAASLAFTTIGIARAASGYRWSTQPGRALSLFSPAASDATATAEPPTAQPAMGSSTEESMETEESSKFGAAMDDDSQEESYSSEQDDDSSEMYGAQQPGSHHHSGSSENPGSSGEDDGD